MWSWLREGFAVHRDNAKSKKVIGKTVIAVDGKEVRLDDYLDGKHG